MKDVPADAAPEVPALGRKAAELIFNRITGEQSPSAHAVILATLVRRGAHSRTDRDDVVHVTVVPGPPPVEAEWKWIGSAVADGVAADSPEVKSGRSG